jgi:hypothetical protein
MAEGFDPSDAPVRRGRRDPRLALELEAGLNDTGEQHDESGEDGWQVGDELIYKVTTEDTNPVTGKDRWSTYGMKTTIRPGETEEEAFTRIVTTTAARLEESIEFLNHQAEQAEAERRAQPIVPQRTQ